MGRKNNKKKILQSKAELKSIINHASLLRKQIQHDLPIEIRKAVLMERLNSSMENVSKYYKEAMDIREALVKMNVDTSPQIAFLKTIEPDIEPKYLLNENISTNNTYLTILFSLSSIVATIFPYPFNYFLGYVFLFVGIPLLFMVIGNILILKSEYKTKTKLRLLLIGGIALAIVSFCITKIIILIRDSSAIYQNSFSFHVIPYFTLITAGLCLIYTAMIARQLFSKPIYI